MVQSTPKQNQNKRNKNITLYRISRISRISPPHIFSRYLPWTLHYTKNVTPVVSIAEQNISLKHNKTSRTISCVHVKTATARAYGARSLVRSQQICIFLSLRGELFWFLASWNQFSIKILSMNKSVAYDHRQAKFYKLCRHIGRLSSQSCCWVTAPCNQNGGCSAQICVLGENSIYGKNWLFGECCTFEER